MTDKIEVYQFRVFIVRPTLEHLDPIVPYSQVAEDLLVGTALYETGISRFSQWLGKSGTTLGPGIGVYQIERPTLADVFANFIVARQPLADRIRMLRASVPAADEQLASNLAFATAIARVIYFRHPQPLPAPGDVDGMGAYYKLAFNTAKGAGDAAKWAETYRQFA